MYISRDVPGADDVDVWINGIERTDVLEADDVAGWFSVPHRDANGKLLPDGRGGMVTDRFTASVEFHWTSATARYLAEVAQRPNMCEEMYFYRRIQQAHATERLYAKLAALRQLDIADAQLALRAWALDGD